jgi:hypothetical protein
MKVGLGNGQGPHLCGTGDLEHSGARFERCTGGPHVIDQDDRSALEPSSAPSRREKGRKAEGAIEVAAPRSGIEGCLWCCGAHAPEDSAHRHAQMPRQFLSLVEAPSCAPPWMERDRHNAVRALQQLTAGFCDERRQGMRQLTPPIVFERMNDRPQCSLVVPGCSRGVDRAWGTTTAGTLFEGCADDSPGGQWIAARAAERGGEYPDLAPTPVANGSAKRCVEHTITRRATWGERNGEECVYGSSVMG